MPSELRIIRFKLDEVAIALRAFAPRIELDMPDSKLTSVSNNQLAASLIQYCMTGGIPLPRMGNKEIGVSTTYIDLKIGLSHHTLDGESSNSIELDA